MTARVVLLVTSPRLPAGLLTAAAWDLVRESPVLAGAESALTAAVRAAGVEVVVVEGAPADALLAAAAERGTAVWLAGPAGDEDVARALGHRLTREPGRAELELMYGSWDPPGARLMDAVTVMDRLVSPGGDPWKRQQTHQTLAQFLLEECYEAYDAIEAGDLASLREELGDLLLQVVLHARLAEEQPEDSRWTVDDVAGDLVAKLIRRNPHVFAGATVDSVDEVVDNWEQIKRAEKGRESAMDGIALAQPALALAAKVLQRSARAGVELPVPPAPSGMDVRDPGALGDALLGVVAAARIAGVDAEAALRRSALAYAAAVRATEPPSP
jgi:XTP/dITP diphosphohydrolase